MLLLTRLGFGNSATILVLALLPLWVLSVNGISLSASEPAQAYLAPIDTSKTPVPPLS